MDFNVPIAGHGDSYDRYLVRLQEMRESVRIIYQCLNEMPNGPYKTPDNKIAPPRCAGACTCTHAWALMQSCKELEVQAATLHAASHD